MADSLAQNAAFSFLVIMVSYLLARLIRRVVRAVVARLVNTRKL